MTAQQRIFRERRQYNQWVANETLEDYALRFTARRARRWSMARVANTALGTVAFLALEAIGGAVTLSYGFTNAVAAILAVSAVIFITGIPICYYAARYGLDIDLLTRGAGFGYIGSTVTSLIYASFTFIFFALEASIMALALEMCFGVPLWLGYLICSLLVIPLVTHGITLISRFQFWTQFLWVLLQTVPFIFLGLRGYLSTEDWVNFTGTRGPADGGFDLVAFGAAASVIFALIAQTAEQVDFLRFLPPQTQQNKWAWWTAVIAAGPGWVIPGLIKMLLGSFLAVLILGQGVSSDHAAEPSQMYFFVFSHGLPWPEVNRDVALALVGLFVIVSQLKINVTNAYAGSLAWSNFFSRLTHSHPGRVVWVVFNVSLALVLMELGIFEALEHILRLFSNIPVAWLGVITADLIINKPLGLSPKQIEFKRAYLYDLNPVGIGAMTAATLLAVATYLGLFGEAARGLAPFIALATAMICTPAIAAATKGRYYIARSAEGVAPTVDTCCICEHEFEGDDMAHCPAYAGPICSLCCSLDARCHDLCKDGANLSSQTAGFLNWLLPPVLFTRVNSDLGKYLGLLCVFAAVIAGVFAVIFVQMTLDPNAPVALVADALTKLYFILLIIVAIATWPFVLAQQSSRAARAETQRQTAMLMEEIEAHQKTDRELQRAKEIAEASSRAKSSYVGGISHELRTPLNAIMGYAQLLATEPKMPDSSRPGLRVIGRSAEHIAGLIDGLLDISMIEAGRIQIFRDEVRLADFLGPIIDMFRLQAREKGLEFRVDLPRNLPVAVYTDEKRLRQTLINLLSNAIRATQKGHVTLRIAYRNQVATIEIEDTGCGIAPQDLERIFWPFERVNQDRLPQKSGTGLGLTITKLMTEAMGGSISVKSTLGEGSLFTIRLMLSAVPNPKSAAAPLKQISGYQGERRTLIISDDDPNHVALMRDIFVPLGFNVLTAGDGQTCLDLAARHSPDLILLDISLPDMSGWGVAARLRAEHEAPIPVIIISANPREENRRSEMASVHNDYFMKPVKIPDLLESIRDILGLTWVYGATDDDAKADEVPIQFKPSERLSAEEMKTLRELSDIGHVRGVLDTLTQIEQLHPDAKHAIRLLRAAMHDFDFAEFKNLLDGLGLQDE